MLFDIESETDFTAAERDPPRRARRLHVGKTGNTTQQFLIKFGRLFRFSVSCFRKRDARCDDVGRIESGWNFLQTNKTFD